MCNVKFFNFLSLIFDSVFRFHDSVSVSVSVSGFRIPCFSAAVTINKKPRAKHREYRLAQRRQRRQHSDQKHVQRQRQNTTITLQMEPIKRENTDCRRFKKRWGDQETLTVYSKIIFFDATIGSNSYTICTMQSSIKNIFPTD